MTDLETQCITLGIHIPTIALPRADIDLSRWAVIACDQFTQDPSYWERVAQYVGESPSMLSLIYPEVYLEKTVQETRITAIRQAMQKALAQEVLTEFRGMMYIERRTPYHPRRRGLILALDLERYDWHPEARPLIRATEGTVAERLPPRIAIRRGAPLESPHIIILIDDEKCRLLEGLESIIPRQNPTYHTELMLGAGAVTGWKLDQEKQWQFVINSLEDLYAEAMTKYGPLSAHEEPFLFAVGDGNHSLATAKAVWEEYKAQHHGEPGLMQHPARYALVEIENLYDEGIQFEPIHRLVFGSSREGLFQYLQRMPGALIQPVATIDALEQRVRQGEPGKTLYGIVCSNRQFLLSIDFEGIATVPLQETLDRLCKEQGATLDYIHGSDEIRRIVQGKTAPGKSQEPQISEGREGFSEPLGIILPPIRKESLFATVSRSGPLPRKSFSMGEGIEKRFYLECRKLF